MRRLLRLGSGLAFAALLSSALAGCVVRERTYARTAYPPPPPPCAGGVWVDGHHGPYGHWHPGHWRCPEPGPRVYGRIDIHR